MIQMLCADSWIIDDPVFREQMIDAHEQVVDELERAAIRRAKGSMKKDGSGGPGSADLLKFLLRANRAKFAASASGMGGGAGSVAEQRRQEEEQQRLAQRQKFKIAGQDIEF